MTKTDIIAIFLIAVSLLFFPFSLYVYSTRDADIINTPKNCITAPFGNESCNTDFIGLNVAEAEDLANEQGLRSRVVSDDNRDRFPVHSDHSSQRVNFFLEDNIVTKAEYY